MLKRAKYPLIILLGSALIVILLPALGIIDPATLLQRPVEMPALASGAAPDYALHVEPIFKARCISCHQDNNAQGGYLMTYGSYFRDDQNIPLTATKVMLGDLAVSLLAGIAIFPAVFTFGFQPDAGPGLLFITIPAVFASIPFGNICVVIFFLLAAIAATGAMLSLLEVPVAFIHERFGLARRTTTILVVALIALIGSAAALSNSILADFKFRSMTMFDLYDFVTSNVLLPVGGLFISLFVGWVWGFNDVKQALSNKGSMRNERIVYAFYGIVKLITPVLVVIVLLNGLKLL